MASQLYAFCLYYFSMDNMLPVRYTYLQVYYAVPLRPTVCGSAVYATGFRGFTAYRHSFAARRVHRHNILLPGARDGYHSPSAAFYTAVLRYPTCLPALPVPLMPCHLTRMPRRVAAAYQRLPAQRPLLVLVAWRGSAAWAT